MLVYRLPIRAVKLTDKNKNFGKLIAANEISRAKSRYFYRVTKTSDNSLPYHEMDFIES